MLKAVFIDNTSFQNELLTTPCFAPLLTRYGKSWVIDCVIQSIIMDVIAPAFSDFADQLKALAKQTSARIESLVKLRAALINGYLLECHQWEQRFGEVAFEQRPTISDDSDKSNVFYFTHLAQLEKILKDFRLLYFTVDDKDYCVY